MLIKVIIAGGYDNRSGGRPGYGGGYHQNSSRGNNSGYGQGYNRQQNFRPPHHNQRDNYNNSDRRPPGPYRDGYTSSNTNRYNYSR